MKILFYLVLDHILYKIILDLTNKYNTIEISNSVIEYRLNNNKYNPKNNGIITEWHKRLENRINNLIII